MKTTTQLFLTVASLIASVAFGYVAFAAPVPPTQVPVAHRLPVHHVPVVTTVANVIEVPETIVVVSKKNASPRPKTWTCGALHDLYQGPVNVKVSDCDWK